jgi:hypothetical protein
MKYPSTVALRNERPMKSKISPELGSALLANLREALVL